MGDVMRSAKKKSMSFFTKLFVCFAFLSILPVAVLGTLTHFISSDISMSNLEKQAANIVDTVSSNIELTIAEYKLALSYFCGDSEIIEALSGSISEEISTVIYNKMFMLLAGKSSMVSMHLIKADGSFEISTSEIPKKYNVRNRGGWGIFRELGTSKDVVVYSNRYLMNNGKFNSIAIGQSIRKGDEIIAYAIIDIPEDVIKTATNLANSSISIRYAVMDKNYYLIYNEIFNNSIFLSNEFRSIMEGAGNDRGLVLEEPTRLITWASAEGQYPITVIASVPLELVKMNNNYIMVTTVVIAFVSILLCLILSLLLVSNLTRPMKAIVNTMNKVQNGDIDSRVELRGNDEFGYIGNSLNHMLDKLNELHRTDLEKQNRLRLSEIKALYAQINPHFLYNTLDSVKWLAKLNGIDEIVQIVSQLGKLLKYSINNKKDFVYVYEEVRLVESYISIQKIRYDDKFEANIDIDEEIMPCRIPKFIIQPIVENAIIHGIEDKVGKATLNIRGWLEDNKIFFEVKDDGVGMSEDKLRQIRDMMQYPETEKSRGKDSIGLSNVDKRIKLYYGKEYGLTIESSLDTGTVTRIVLPYWNTLIRDSGGQTDND